MQKFHWNRIKAASNLKRHRVTFEEAQTVYFDDSAVQFFDDKLSAEEDRLILLRLRSMLSMLSVC